MVRSGRSTGVILVIVLFTVAALGCASTAAKPVAAKDLSSLAGKWSGWVRLPTGGSVPATLDLTPSGDYVTRAGAFMTQGKAQVKDGGLVMMSTGASGPLGISVRTSTASLSERSGMLVLNGTGRGDAGPFDRKPDTGTALLQCGERAEEDCHFVAVDFDFWKGRAHDILVMSGSSAGCWNGIMRRANVQRAQCKRTEPAQNDVPSNILATAWRSLRFQSLNSIGE